MKYDAKTFPIIHPLCYYYYYFFTLFARGLNWRQLPASHPPSLHHLLLSLGKPQSHGDVIRSGMHWGRVYIFHSHALANVRFVHVRAYARTATNSYSTACTSADCVRMSSSRNPFSIVKWRGPRPAFPYSEFGAALALFFHIILWWWWLLLFVSKSIGISSTYDASRTSMWRRWRDHDEKQ